MQPQFIVQARAESKWKTVYRGEDQEKAKTVFYKAADRVGTDNLRCLKATELKENGKPKWTLVNVPPIEPEVGSIDDRRGDWSEKQGPKNDFHVFNIWQISDPEKHGGLSDRSYWLWVVLGGLLFPIAGIAYGIWGLRNSSFVKKQQVQSILVAALISAVVTQLVLSERAPDAEPVVSSESSKAIVGPPQTLKDNNKQVVTASVWQKSPKSSLIGYWGNKDGCGESVTHIQSHQMQLIHLNENMRKNNMKATITSSPVSHFSKGSYVSLAYKNPKGYAFSAYRIIDASTREQVWLEHPDKGPLGVGEVFTQESEIYKMQIVTKSRYKELGTFEQLIAGTRSKRCTKTDFDRLSKAPDNAEAQLKQTYFDRFPYTAEISCKIRYSGQLASWQGCFGSMFTNIDGSKRTWQVYDVAASEMGRSNILRLDLTEKFEIRVKNRGEKNLAVELKIYDRQRKLVFDETKYGYGQIDVRN